eukprot:scaffold23406_cov80-Skeletonema_marinoi.AAC.1
MLTETTLPRISLGDKCVSIAGGRVSREEKAKSNRWPQEGPPPLSEDVSTACVQRQSERRKHWKEGHSQNRYMKLKPTGEDDEERPAICDRRVYLLIVCQARKMPDDARPP